MAMTDQQNQLVDKLEQLLNEMGQRGLSGGIFDGAFCVWLSGNVPSFDKGDFFSSVQSAGGRVLHTPGMWLDGGAGN